MPSDKEQLQEPCATTTLIFHSTCFSSWFTFQLDLMLLTITLQSHARKRDTPRRLFSAPPVLGVYSAIPIEVPWFRAVPEDEGLEPRTIDDVSKNPWPILIDQRGDRFFWSALSPVIQGQQTGVACTLRFACLALDILRPVRGA